MIYQQQHRISMQHRPAPGGKRRWYRISITGGQGGHADADMAKGRCNAVIPVWAILATIYNEYDFDVASIRIGQADDAIAATADVVVCVPSGEASEFVKQQESMMNDWLREEYPAETNMRCTIEKCECGEKVLPTEAFEALMTCLEQTPQGIVKVECAGGRQVEAANNVGRVCTAEDHILVTTLTSSADTEGADRLGKEIEQVFSGQGSTTTVIDR
ncbi:MAG: hypothetical protein IJ155_05965 [Prevotella sp.]|nr:hypothetical protein [Prevotella sp.]